jgi:hypothetical protein
MDQAMSDIAKNLSGAAVVPKAASPSAIAAARDYLGASYTVPGGGGKRMMLNDMSHEQLHQSLAAEIGAEAAARILARAANK